jgi:hypothetical protein
MEALQKDAEDMGAAKSVGAAWEWWGVCNPLHKNRGVGSKMLVYPS